MIDRARRMSPLPNASEEGAEPGRFGCPMLTPLQWEHAAALRVPASRCLIGWSLTDDLAIARCRATHAVIDCWKAHPERTPILGADDEHPPHLSALRVAAAD